MKRTCAGEDRNGPLLVAIAVNTEGYREMLGISERAKEYKAGWSAFLHCLIDRGFIGVQLGITPALKGHASTPDLQNSD